MTKIRTWTDRSGSFKVEAQFIGLKDGKIHLHKLNGVKIAVPVVKMAIEDLEYVEKATGVSLDEDKPVSEIIKRSQSKKQTNGQQPKSSPTVGLQVEKKPVYDWFDFFLKCGVGVHQCERYSYNFNKDSMDQSVLEDITPEVLRNLGLKEGDVLRVMKYLDTKYGRTGAKAKAKNVSFGGEDAGEEKDNGGLFSGPGGTLKNTTRKGRPAPRVQTSDIVDSKVFKQKSDSPELDKDTPESPEAPKPPAKDQKAGFDDDAWDVKPSKQPARVKDSTRAVSTPPPTSAASAPEPAPPKPALTGAMKELSLLDEPLQPVVMHAGAAQQPSQPQMQQQQAPPVVNQSQPQPPQTQPQFQSFQPSQQQPPQQQQLQQPQGATPALFGQLGPQPTGMPQQMANPPLPQIISQQTGLFNALPRQRPQAPPMAQQQNSIIPPPPTRPLSAPQNQQSSFAPPPLQPQLTGVGYQTQSQNQMTSPTQTLNDLQRMRLQAQMSPPQQQQPQFTGFPGQSQQFGMMPNGMQQNSFAQSQLQGLLPQITGIPQNPYILGQQAGSPFADPRLQQQQSLHPQMTGFQPNMTSQTFYQPMAPQPTASMNSVFSPPLQPQITGMSGMNGFANQPSFGQAPPPVPQIPQQFGGPQAMAPQQQIPSPPPIPQQPTIAPLQPQKTGPAPPVKFGMQPEVKKLAPQPTGRRANLSHASKCLTS